MARRPIFGIALIALVLSACSGALSVAPGDAVTPPELGTPTIEIVALAADDLVAVPSKVTANGVELADSKTERPVVEWEGTPIELIIEADGFSPREYTIEKYPDGGRIEFRLEPVVLSGRVTTDAGRPLPGAAVILGDAQDMTDNEGRYALERAIPGTISLSRPAWNPVEYPWGGAADQFDMSMTPKVINALRVAPDSVLDTERWDTILDLADRSGINALAIDLKTEDGTVAYPTDVPTANAIGAVSSYFDASDVVAQAKEHDLYLIGRIGVFQDSFFAEAEPGRAVTNEDGTLWRSRNGYAWLDPSDPASFEYSIALAEEACRLGFDEIQFDYVSYPIGGDVSTAVFDGAYNQEVRVASISAFLTRAYSVLHPTGCTVSTTILGIVLESTADEGVGQLPSTMSRIVDVLSPTLYTTNYRSGWKGFENPDDNAVEIVTTALAGGKSKLDGQGYLRPWLQTWAIDTQTQRAVQSAVTEDGMGWLLWSNSASYSADALPPR
ncbi:MAG: putative glycoside hydrolase [Acidimicrobiia bacterium]|nr:MAG: putative glycoside hydrolase [Acidimicrobiia bacterium]